MRPTPYSRTKRRLPVRIERLRWLRGALADPLGCVRETEVDEITVRATPIDGEQIEPAAAPAERADRLADEFFGRRYKARAEGSSVVFIGRPL